MHKSVMFAQCTRMIDEDALNFMIITVRVLACLIWFAPGIILYSHHQRCKFKFLLHIVVLH